MGYPSDSQGSTMASGSTSAMDGGEDDLALLQELGEVRERLVAAIGTRIVGQRKVVDQLLVALFAQGHCLFIGVPGLAKTLLVSTAARALGLSSGRVQFTPDLMPADITGTEVLEEDRSTGRRELRFIPGPIFTNLLLADEINRTPPKTQAALLEAMQERRVTAGGRTYPLQAPFLVFATQNPIEQEGTYPLPEAELDRFMFSVRVGYPTEAEEIEVVRRTTGVEPEGVEAVLGREKLLQLQALVRRLPVSDDVHRYAVRLARATRPGPGALDFVNRWVRWGAGPRASQYLSLGARVQAALEGRKNPKPADVESVAQAVLSHRIVLGFQAEAEGIGAETVVERILSTVGAR